MKICIAEEKFRKWTSSSGRILEAKFIKFSGNSIVLKRVDGRQFTLLPEIFVESDREYLQSLRNTQTSSRNSKSTQDEFYNGATLVVALNGQVEIMSSFSNYNGDYSDKNESDSKKLVKDGDILPVGSKIKVSSDSGMTLLFSSGTIARVGENSIFSINEFLQKDFEKSEKKVSELNQEVSQSTLLLNLNVGDLIVDVKKLDKESSLEVRTDLGVAGIRGTSFQLFVSEDMSKLSVLSGSVEFKKNGGSPINTLANKVVLVERDNDPEVSDINPGEKELINTILERIKKDADGIDLSTLRGKLGMKHKFHVVPSAGNMEMIWVEPGQLVFPPEMRRRPIEIKTGFYLGKYEVTQNEYALVKNSSNAKGRWPSYFSRVKGAQNRPVESISFQDVRSFLNNLNTIEDKAGRVPEGWKFVLPTEDEFWYASYAGINSKYPWGDVEIPPSYANFDHGNDANQTLEVGQFPPNEWGFYDLIGNVAELTASGSPIGGAYSHSGSYITRITRGKKSHNGFRVVFKAIEKP
jgi:hypothetical protein